MKVDELSALLRDATSGRAASETGSSVRTALPPSAAPAVSTEAVIEEPLEASFSFATMVSNMGGDEPTARRILAKWNPTEQIENLNRAVAALEAEPAIKEQRLAGTLAKQVERAAHQLKGTCGYITAIDASAGAKRLQDAARVRGCRRRGRRRGPGQSVCHSRHGVARARDHAGQDASRGSNLSKVEEDSV